MKKYYLGVNGSDATFWEHEYNKHGTCYSTLRSECFRPEHGLSAEDTVVLDYFREIVKQWRERPTFKYLKKNGIVPDASKTYKFTDLQAALTVEAGAQPYVGCQSGTNKLSEVWYYYHTYGNLIGGVYEPTKCTFCSNCPADVLYQPKV